MSDVKFVRNSAGFRELLLSTDVEVMLQIKADRVKAAAEASGVMVNATGHADSGAFVRPAAGRVTQTWHGAGLRSGGTAIVAEGGGAPRTRTAKGSAAGQTPMPYDTEVHRSPSRVRVRVRAVHPAGARAEVKHRALGQAIDAAR